MGWFKKLSFWLYKRRAGLRRLRRYYFPSPAEIELIRIMGGKCIIIDHIVDRRTGFPLTIVTNMGRILKRELIQREVRVGAMYIDFGIANRYYKRGIEIDGRDFHRDITVEQERDEYLAKYGWSVLHIQAADIYRQPMLVQRKVLNFLAR